jgi:hypothetical protein
MLGETVITERPPLSACYGRVGERVRIPLRGSHARRFLHGAINVRSGDVLLPVTEAWTGAEPTHFLNLIRAHRRGRHIVLFEGRAKQHAAPPSLRMAAWCSIEVRLLPRATPELKAMDHLWRHTRQTALSDRPTETIERSAQPAGEHILGVSRRERLRRARAPSANCWLPT